MIEHFCDKEQRQWRSDLTHQCLRVTFEIVVWIFNTFNNNLENKPDFIKYLKKCW